MLRHSRESGNPEAVVRNIGPVFLRKRRKEIPAFAGMTKCYSVVIVLYNTVTSAIRLSRSETPDFFTHSFAGMTKYYCRVIVFHGANSSTHRPS